MPNENNNPLIQQLMETKTLQTIQAWLTSYERMMHKNGLTSTASNWIALSIGTAVLLGIAGFFLFDLIQLDAPLLLAFVAFFTIIDIMLGYPIALDMQRTDQIEEAFPNVLKQLADTLKAGGTYEFALREVSDSDYGPLTDELKLVLRRIEEGQNLDQSLKLMQENIDSRLVKRTLTIIIDALRSGGGLSEILDEIADDMRDMRRIYLERKTRTTMQSWFLVASGTIIGPAILGFTTTIVEFLIATATSTQIVETLRIETAIQAKQFIIFLLTGYIVIQTIAASFLLGLMREGKARKSIIYLPLLLFTALLMFYLARIATSLLLRGFA